MDEDGELDLHLLFLDSVARTRYFADFQDAVSQPELSCHKFTNNELGQYNYGIWCLCFVLLGMQYTHLAVGPLAKIAIDWSSMKTWGAGLWVFFLSIICFILYVTYRLVLDYLAVGVARRYIAAAVCILGFIYFNTKRMHPRGYYLHIHHYLWSYTFTAFICY